LKLNKIERLKFTLPPFKYSLFKVDFFNLSEDDRFYLKNFGIYNTKLRKDEFFIRVRIPAGHIEKSKIIYILTLAKEFNVEIILTARAQLELHKATASNVYTIYKRLIERGITTHQTLTDNFRNIVTSPFDGIGKNSKIYCYPIIMKMQKVIGDNPKFFGMIPRKFNVAILGEEFSPFGFFGNDLYFGIAKKGDRLGFNIYVGGKNSSSAKDIDIFLDKSLVPNAFEAVANIYLKYGLRGNRAKTRLYFLIESIGVDKFRELMVEELGELESKGEYLAKREDFKEQRDGLYLFQSRYGKIDIDEFLRIVEVADKVWLGVDQNIYYIAKNKIEVQDRDFASNQITACAGSRYCALSLWDIKSDVDYLPIELIKKHNITIGFSGCLKGCGRHHFADIGIVGLRTNIFGKTAKSARVFLGGIYTKEEASPARLIFYAIPLEHLNSFVTLVINEFLLYKFKSFEDFSFNLLNRYSEGFLMVWFLSKIYLKHNLLLNKSEDELFKDMEALEDFPKGVDSKENYIELVNYLKHKVWDY
jgi:ferredoxin-nitrite reductase